MDRLMRASHEGNINGLYLAIQEDATVLEQVDAIPFVNTPLHIAASAGHIEYAMEIMRLKPSFARKPNHDGFSPMHVALQKEQTKMVLWLLAMDGELVRVKGREGVTPLHQVVGRGRLDLLNEFLLSCPKSIEDLTIRNESAFHVALKSDNFQAFDLLLKRLQSPESEANFVDRKILNKKDVQGNTLVHVAAARNQPQAIESLLKWHSFNPGILQVEAVNENGLTALEIAVSYRHLGVERLLWRPAASGRMVSFDAISTPNPPNQPLQDLNRPQEEIATGNLVATPQQGPPPERQRPSRRDIIDWSEYFKFDFNTTDAGKTRTDLLVVAVLMATTTFQSGLSPPGGLDENDHTAVLSANGASYILFMIFNSAGFFMSLYTIVVLINKYPLFWETYVAIFAMVATYNTAIGTISPGIYMKVLSAALGIFMPICIPIISVSLRRWFKGRKAGATASSNQENA